jgi:glycosyltransferase involved in cell wall biosynthesis
VGGGTELVSHQETGLHFSAESSVALATAIDQLIENPALCDDMGQLGAAKLLQRFSLRQEAQNFLSLFNALRLSHP